ncbi:phage antirepressor KilAC domain-containing protein [Romboutsia lituseburensis]|uniref:phage antirepressor KilAC domain-containing protein n=1 Tax=Romboutsia lituseburensis TaxID=1537 RepID=UPI00215B5364|nr:phage antirepressor KilAC domain-containing protein [Romboutsia lituseburensis]MCR8745229.1 phage antirepressor KilAC domain-containing protein [Romboutsia lituseburensis]
MSNNIQVLGIKNILGVDVPVIEGGFGKGQKGVLAKDIADIHGNRLDKINDLIKNNIGRFDMNDLIDLKSKPCEGLQLANLGFTNMQISKTNNIYLLSERGYTKLVSMMDNSNDKKWEIMDRLIDEYFTIRAVINSEEQIKANLLLSIYNGGQDGIVASKQLSEIEIKEATLPLLEQIQADAPKVEAYEEFIDTDNTYTLTTCAKMLGIKPQKELIPYLKNVGLLTNHNMATSTAVKKGVMVIVPNEWKTQTRVTSYGIDYIRKNYKKDKDKYS